MKSKMPNIGKPLKWFEVMAITVKTGSIHTYKIQETTAERAIILERRRFGYPHFNVVSAIETTPPNQQFNGDPTTLN